MSVKKRGLGKGLNELLSATLGSSYCVMEDPPEVSDEEHILSMVAVNALRPGPFQPRKQIAHDALEELAESIKAQGIIQPIVARKKDSHYEIVAGERRWRAAQLAGLETVPVMVRNISEQAALAIALIENIQRQDLNPIEEASALKRLIEELQLTHLQVAEAIGKSRTSVTNLLRLLSLSSEVQSMLEQGLLEMGHARALLSLSEAKQLRIAKQIVEKNLSVRETEKLVHSLQSDQEPMVSIKTEDPNIRRLEEALADKLGARVNIRHGRRGHGMVVIRYHDVDELEGILAHIQ